MHMKTYQLLQHYLTTSIDMIRISSCTVYIVRHIILSDIYSYLINIQFVSIFNIIYLHVICMWTVLGFRF